MGTQIIGALTPEEQAIIDERDALVERFRLASSEEEADELLTQIDELLTQIDELLTQIDEQVKAYDAVRRERRARGEIQ